MFKNLNPGSLGHNLPFDQTVTLAKKHGFSGVDLDLGYLGQIRQAQSLQAAHDWFSATGLRPGAISVGAKWREGDSEADFEASLGQVKSDAQLAQALGCTRATTWMMPGSNKHPFRQHWALVAPRLMRVAELVGEHGLAFGIEFVGPATLRAKFKYDFIHTMDAMRTFCAEIGKTSNNTGLLLDCFHLYTAKGLNSDINFLDPQEVVYVHVNDAKAGRTEETQIDQEREMVGATGVIDIRGFFDALKRIGYDGPVAVEPFNQAVRDMPAEDAIRLTSQALDRVM